MKLVKLTLHKNKRLHLNDTDTIVIESADNIRSIVLRGVSGIGKSTILAQLSPLPPNMRDFHQGGYKEIVIEHKGKIYILTSSGSNAGKHSFLIGGVEHNVSGSQTMQLDLIKEHFRYDSTIHSYMLGLERFTRLSGTARRELFATLSNTDNKFISDLWEAIRVGQRDNTGALKNIEEKIAEQTSNLVSEDVVEEQTKLLESLKKDYQELVGLRHQYNLGNRESIPDAFIDSVYDVVVSLYKTMESEYFAFNAKYGDRSATSIVDGIAYLKSSIREANSSKAKIIDEIDGLNQKKHTYEFELEDETVSSEEIQKNINETNASIDALREKYPNIAPEIGLLVWTYGTDTIASVCRYSNPGARIGTHGFSHYYSDVVAIGEFDYDEAVKQKRELNDNVVLLTNKLNAIKNAIAHNTTHLDSLLAGKVLTCPQCQHQFRENNADQTITSVEENIKKLEEAGQAKINEIEELNMKISVLDDKLRAVKQFCDYLTTYSGYRNIITGIWLRNVSEDELYSYVVKNISLLRSVEHRASQVVEYVLEMDKLKKQLQHYTMLQEAGRVKQSKEYHELISRLKYLEETLNGLDDDIISKERQLTEHLDALSRIDSIRTAHDKLIKQYQSVETGHKESINEAFVNTVLDGMYALAEQIKRIEELLAHRVGITYVIEHLKNNQTSVMNSIDTHKKLIEVMNPKDGLIAKTQVGFVRQFISEMNNVIKQVWTYPLVLSPDDEGAFMKDFKIPVFIGGKEGGTSKDVLDTSTGQSEIIDFAFRVVMMKYLGLEEWVIYADELGSSLNPKHRYNLYGLLKRMVDENRVSQLYVITHLSDVENILEGGILIELKTN